MGGLGQELLAARHRFQNATLALLAEFVRDSTSFGDQFDQRGRHMRVELINDEDPLRVRVAVNRILDVRDEIFLGTSGTYRTFEDQSGRHIEVSYQA